VPTSGLYADKFLKKS